MTLPKIDYPVFEITLPSSKKKIKLRQMLTKDQKILLVAKEANQVGDVLSAIKQVCNNCLAQDGIDINSLTTYDIEYIFLKLRAVSVNNISKQSYTDLEDNKNYDFDIDLDKIDVLFPEQAPSNTIKVNDMVTISLKAPQAIIYDNQEIFVAKGDVTDQIARYCLDKIHIGDTVVECSLQTPEEVKTFIDNLDIKSFDQMRVYIEQLPRLNHEIVYTNSLKHERKIVLSSLTDFFSF